jgi:hypothetical protein
VPLIFGEGSKTMNILRKSVTACALAGAGLVLAIVPAGAALASTTVGQTGAPVTNDGWAGGSEEVQTSAAMPSGGVVTSLNTQSGSCPLFKGTFDLQVLRPLGGGQFKVLGDTGNQTDPCDSQLHSYPVGIPVQAGDVIGAYIVDSWQGLLPLFGGTRSYDFIAEPAVGDTITLSNTSTDTLDESATLSEDASGLAATLVSDTSGLPPGNARLVHAATAIQAAVNSGNTPTACADITNFLALVKAQTGKKLTTAQAAQLTTDADNLAAALGC